MFVTGGSICQRRCQVRHGTMIGGEKPGDDSQQRDRRNKETREWPLLHKVISHRTIRAVQLIYSSAVRVALFLPSRRMAFISRSNQLSLKALRLLQLRPMP